MTIVEFLQARLAEDEAAAQLAKPGPWTADAHEVIATHPTDLVVDYVYDESAAHIARHDPARVLREVEAKRVIVTEHDSQEVASLDRDTWAQTYQVCRRCRIGERQIVAPCPTLRLLASVYADHPDYDQAWTLTRE